MKFFLLIQFAQKMKGTKLIVLIFLAVFLHNCDKENAYFSGINNYGDWQMNDEFSEREKSLFDSLNFNKTAVWEPEETGAVEVSPLILFSPNPFTDFGSLSYNSAPIINIAIVNKEYDKIIECRFENSYEIAFNFSDKPSGIYRLYYVIQDSVYNVVHLGHGNIEKK